MAIFDVLEKMISGPLWPPSRQQWIVYLFVVSFAMSLVPARYFRRTRGIDFIVRWIFCGSLVFWLLRDVMNSWPGSIKYYNLVVISVVLTSFWFLSERLRRLNDHRAFTAALVGATFNLSFLYQSVGAEVEGLLLRGSCILFAMVLIFQLYQKKVNRWMVMTPLAGLFLGSSAILFWQGQSSKLLSTALSLLPVWTLLPMGWFVPVSAWRLQIGLVALASAIGFYFQ